MAECRTKSARAWFEACRAAEARVEALSEALRQIAENKRVAVPTSDPRPEVIDGAPATVTYVRYERPDAVAIARAALACPPQQRGEQ